MLLSGMYGFAFNKEKPLNKAWNRSPYLLGEVRYCVKNLRAYIIFLPIQSIVSFRPYKAMTQHCRFYTIRDRATFFFLKARRDVCM